MQAKSRRYRSVNLIISVAAVACMWLVWLVACAVTGNEYIVPSVGDTLRSLAQLFFSLERAPEYWLAFGMTFARSLGAWAMSFFIASCLAALTAASPRIRAFVAPFVAVIRILPVMAVTLMLLIWSSRSFVPVIVSFLTLCPLMSAQFIAAYDGIDGKLVEMAKVYGLPRAERVFKIYLPQMLPSVLSQAGANLSLSLKVVVSAEVLASSFRAIGGLINQANLFLDTAQMFALTISVLIFGGLIEWGCSFLTRITDRYTKKGGGNAH